MPNHSKLNDLNRGFITYCMCKVITLVVVPHTNP